MSSSPRHLGRRGSLPPAPPLGDRRAGAVRLSVNLASKDLEEPDYARTIARALSRTGSTPTDSSSRSPNGWCSTRMARPGEHRPTPPTRGAVHDRRLRHGQLLAQPDRIVSRSAPSRSTSPSCRSSVPTTVTILVSAIISMADRLGLDCVAEGGGDVPAEPDAPAAGLHSGPGLLLQPAPARPDIEAPWTMVPRTTDGNAPATTRQSPPGSRAAASRLVLTIASTGAHPPFPLGEDRYVRSVSTVGMLTMLNHKEEPWRRTRVTA
jgi:hypothetical protein